MKQQPLLSIIIPVSFLLGHHVVVEGVEVQCLSNDLFCVRHSCQGRVIYVTDEPSYVEGYIRPPCHPLDNVTHLVWRWDVDPDLPPDLQEPRRVLDSSFTNLPSLETVIISGTKRVDEWEADGLAVLPTLRHLQVVDSLLYKDGLHLITDESANPFRGLSQLQKLELKSLELATISSNKFRDLVSLRYLNLDHNHLTSLTTSGLTSITSGLRRLSLADNRLSQLAAGDFHHLTGLEELDLSRNKIETLSGSPFSGNMLLHKLVLDGNKLTVMSGEALVGLDRLEYLDLGNNHLMRLDHRTFRHTPNLVTLHLSHNQLINLAHLTLNQLPQLQSVYLYGNPNLVACFNRSSLSTQVNVYSDACSTPPSGWTTPSARGVDERWDSTAAPTLTLHGLVVVLSVLSTTLTIHTQVA